MTQVSGNLIYHMKDMIIRFYGRDEYKNLIADIDPISKEILEGIIISGDWYDIKVYQDLIGSVLENKGKDELIRLNKELASKQLSGLFGFVTKLISPEYVINKSQSLWKKLHSEGSIEVVDFNEKNIKIEVHDFEFSGAHLIGTTAYFEQLIQILIKRQSTSQTLQVEKKEYRFIFNLQ